MAIREVMAVKTPAIWNCWLDLISNAPRPRLEANIWAVTAATGAALGWGSTKPSRARNQKCHEATFNRFELSPETHNHRDGLQLSAFRAAQRARTESPSAGRTPVCRHAKQFQKYYESCYRCESNSEF